MFSRVSALALGASAALAMLTVFFPAISHGQESEYGVYVLNEPSEGPYSTDWYVRYESSQGQLSRARVTAIGKHEFFGTLITACNDNTSYQLMPDAGFEHRTVSPDIVAALHEAFCAVD